MRHHCPLVALRRDLNWALGTSCPPHANQGPSCSLPGFFPLANTQLAGAEHTLGALENRVYFWSFYQNIKKRKTKKTRQEHGGMGARRRRKKVRAVTGKALRKTQRCDGTGGLGQSGWPDRTRGLPVWAYRMEGTRPVVQIPLRACTNQPPTWRSAQGTEKRLGAQPHVSPRFSEFLREGEGKGARGWGAIRTTLPVPLWMVPGPNHGPPGPWSSGSGAGWVSGGWVWGMQASGLSLL